MEIMETPLGDEIQRVIDEAKNEHFYWSAIIHSGDFDHEATKVLNIDIVEKYDTKFCPEITLFMLIPAGKYQYRLMPNIHQTEVTLQRYPISPLVGGYDPDGPDISMERYTAVIDHVDAPHLESNSMRKLNEDDLDISDAVYVRCRLLPKAMEKFKLRFAGATFRKEKVEDVIKNILITHSEALDIPVEYKPKGVDMVKPKDERVREHYLIPHRIHAHDAPAYVHKCCGGVYSNGFSYFYKNDFWFVWPTYDHTRFNDVEETLTIINVPANQFPSLDKTWRLEEKALTILSTSEVRVHDSSEHNQHTVGNGARFTTATSLKELTVDTKDNKAVISRAKHNNELIFAERKNKLDNVTTIDSYITDNRHYVMSNLTLRDGVFIAIQWEHSSPQLIRPGMQTRLMYLEKDNVVEKYGVVVAINSNTSLLGQAVTAGQHSTTSQLVLFCERVVFDLA